MIVSTIHRPFRRAVLTEIAEFVAYKMSYQSDFLRKKAAVRFIVAIGSVVDVVL